MPSPNDRLYNLLPAIYRIRDAAEDELLRSLLAVVEQELGTVEDNISDLYENWFIETCEEWVVPYIGDLLDVRDLQAANLLTNSQQASPYGQQERRAYVANTLAYRRRKGTTPVLEQLVRDVTGWRSRAVEFFQLLSTTQQLNHARPANTSVNLRAANSPELVGTPFEQRVAYTAEVRRISDGRTDLRQGRYGTSNIGLFVWRLQSYLVERSTARSVIPDQPNKPDKPDKQRGCYMFSPLGYDMPLFNQPQTETDIIHLAQEINLPEILRSTALQTELTAQNQAALAGKPPDGIRYFDSDPVLQIFVNRQPKPIPPEEILICKLKDETGGWLTAQSDDRSSQTFPTKVVAVDPEAGRLAFLDQSLPKQVEVSYLYGFSGDIGSGTYSRNPVVMNELPAGYTQTIRPHTSDDTNPLAIAIQTWNQTMQAWQGLQDKIYIPLAKLEIANPEISRESSQPNRRFKPGIIRGLQVVASPGSHTVVVTPGAAVDRQGRLILLNSTESFPLQPQPSANGKPFQAEHLLGIAYQATQQEQHWQLLLLPEAAIAGYAEGSFILLQGLTLDESGKIISLSDRPRPAFSPGLVSGLRVSLPPGKLEAIATPGTAIDARGRVFTLMANYAVDLTPHQGKAGVLAIVRTGKGRTRRWKIKFLQSPALSAVLSTDPEATATPLANLEIPQVTATLDNSVRTDQIKQGLTVVPVAGTAQVKVTAGVAIDSQKRRIKLESDYQVDLSAYRGQTIVLFVAYSLEPGLPLTLIAQHSGMCWKHLGILPLDQRGILPFAEPKPGEPKPTDPTFNTITLQGNGTYAGDLSILIPANRRLQIIAAAGDRPHILGNLAVRGAAKPTKLQSQPGELWLEGLLLEGQLQVLPGNLKRLSLDHCTLVPQQGGLTVETAPSPDTTDDEDDPEDDVTLMAFILYCLTLIGKLFQIGTGLDRPPIQNLGQLRQIAIQQLVQLYTDLDQAIEQWQCLKQSSQQRLQQRLQKNSSLTPELGCCWDGLDELPGEGDEYHNDSLEITLGQTICGVIQLAKTVPKLSLTDSIIDATGQVDEQAITAPGTDVEIYTSTVLGGTWVRSLEASNSLFTRKVVALRQQVGCVRFSYVPENSQTPRRYRCQPDLAFATTLHLLPKKITALRVNAFRLGLTFAATAGDGIFHWDQSQWIAANQGLTNLNVTVLLDEEPETGLCVLWAGTAAGGLFRSIDQGTTWTNVSHGETNTKITALAIYPPKPDAAHPHVLLVGTSGGGLFQLTEGGKVWTPLSTHLPNQNITAIAINPTLQIFVGTAGSGIFRLIPSQPNQPQATWMPLNSGLTDLNITALAIDANGYLFAGTENSGIFRSTLNGKVWMAMHQGLTSLQITTLVIHPQRPVSGTIATQRTQVTGTGTAFVQELNPGDGITAARQTHIIDKITSETSLALKSAFLTDLPDETSFIHNPAVFAGAANGQLFRSMDGGQSWQPLTLGQNRSDITAVAIAPQVTLQLPNTEFLVGTAAGNIMRSIGGEDWTPFNQGFINVEDKLLIMNRLQPRFTSEQYGDPGYAQLSQDCALEIRTGAEDESEMGAFSFLKQPQREANLRASLDDHLRFGLEAGLFYIN